MPMKEGTVVSIHIAPEAEAAMRAVPEARAVPGRGLEGDRYFNQAGTFSHKKELWNEVTFIETEILEDLALRLRLDLKPGESRRNVTTRGVALNSLVGQNFRVGETRFRGLRLCEPCSHLNRLTGKDVKEALTHRGGLRAQVLAEGTIRVGDAVVAAEG